MERELAKHLFDLAAAFQAATGLMESTVARKVADDGRFFANLRAGMTFTARKYDLVVERFAAIWPPGVPLPEVEVRQREAENA